MKKNKTIKTSKLVLIVLIASFFVIIGQLIHIAMFDKVDGIDIASFAKNRNTTTKTLYASRGSIYDVNGDILAQTANSYTVIAYLSESRTKDINNPKHVVDKEMTARKLSEVFEKNKITSMTYEYILELLSKNRYQVELGPGGREITEVLKSEIESLSLPGIAFTKSTMRYYTKSTLAPYIIGYAKKNDDGKITGEMGIEKYYDDELEGEDGKTTYETDVYGYRLPNSTETTVEPKEGKDIYLTIDSNIQLFLENSISELSDKYEMSWLTFTVADAKTGAILGSASNPTFDLNKQNMESYLNPLVSYQYEPGSTMKIFSFLAAMDNNVYKGSNTYMSGSVKVGDTTIHDFNDVGWGEITYDTGFAYSSNVGAVYLSKAVGREKLREFYDRSGFGQKTGITLPGEVEGYANFIYDTEIATASFGQGITTTPIQNIQALTMLANDGIILKPYIVSKIVDRTTGNVDFTGQRQEIRQVTSKDNIEKIRKLMDNALYDTITDAAYYQPSNIRMIGKTGTANIPSSKGGYLKGKYDYIRSFAGLFPAEDPKYIIYVSTKQFIGPIKALAKAVTSVVEDVANYKNIAELDSTVSKNEIIVLDNYLNTLVEETEEKIKNLNLNPIILGDGKYVLKMYPNKDSKVLKDSKVFIVTSQNNYVMPDVLSWSENEIKTFCNLIGLNYNISGYGRVVSQSIAANSVIDLNDTLTIVLE
ncbi:MAG: penicillin-binding protein [Bacilli bacterium]|nr:penicillin-binding protein [Bacilli bacterium]